MAVAGEEDEPSTALTTTLERSCLGVESLALESGHTVQTPIIDV